MTRSKKLIFICLLLACVFTLSQLSLPAGAWLQVAHVEINRQAVSDFTASFAKSAKYNNASVDMKYMCEAPNIIGSALFDYEQNWAYLSAGDQIINGGFSADEPNVYVSVRHFYDPLALSGKNELTDQETAFGLAYTPIPATEWALWNEENPYSLHAAMVNYKKSMELPSDTQVAALPVIGNFRDFAGTPSTIEEMRDMYLGKAMRGLGEVMHLVADMTQPAHVRNDSHPKWEVTEQAVTAPVAAASVGLPRLDSVNLGGAANSVYDIMVALSTYTNSHFYSADTITDIASGLNPNNSEKPYASPNFSKFTKDDYDGFETYFATFSGKKIPMVSMAPGFFYGTNYSITPSIARAQSTVLLPLAAAANTQVIDLFFPTLVMDQQVQEVACDPDMLEKAKKQGAEELKQYEAAIKLEHQVSKDTLWTGEGLEIRYSGPGQLWLMRNNRAKLLSDVEFKNGVLVTYQDAETGEQTEGNPIFYLPTGAEKAVSLTGPVIDYTVEYGDAVYVTVNAGARTITSTPYVFEQEAPEMTLTAGNDDILPGEKVSFAVEIKNPPERYKLEWSFGDEDAEAGELPVINKKTTMTHVYEKGGDFTVTVRLIDTKRNIVRCSDTLDISSELGEMEGRWNITLKVEKESKIFRQFVIGVMKVIIRYIISPLVEALGGGPVDESSVESFTMVGTEIYYDLDLVQSEDNPGEFSGALTYVGSNTDYINGPENYISLRMEIEDGFVTFFAQGYDETGNYIDVPFLTGGTMTSPGYIQGKYDFGGTISGVWIASKG